MNPITQDQVGQARTSAETAAKSANEFSAGGYTLADELRKAIGERYNNSPQAQQTATARSTFLQAAPAARLDVQNLVDSGSILSPAQQDAILSAKRASALIPLMVANSNEESMFGNIKDLVGAGTNAYNAETARRQGLAQIAQQSYGDLLTNFYKQLEEQRTAELFPLQKEKLKAEIAATGRGTQADQYKIAKNGLIQDVRQGITFSQAIRKYGATLDNQEIYNTYNSAGSPWGPIKATEEELSSMGISSGLTAEAKNRQTALKPAAIAVDSLSSNKSLNILGPQNKLAQLSIKTLGGLGANSDLVDLNSQFELLKQQVVRSFQGARMSDNDIAIATSYIPSITDTPETAKTKLKNLQTLINQLSGGKSSGSGGNNSDPLGIR